MNAVFKPVARLFALISCTALFAPLAAVAAPYHHHEACHVEHHHGHAERVCHRVH
ncbi:hypothetical protein [Paraburkholderia lycopersici]|uniref:Cobalt transporter subunit CbtB n=1 Tax=Paraburkholderia lycopersici TaxID=416944 RepID=A0A1G6RGR4_9BURK|nr:hypothetical protein [Paraburkholderia lycopersici]SDD03812.1 hypothetical protein SAMN05421548_113124 [Paraburkholderia lycopersici]